MGSRDEAFMSDIVSLTGIKAGPMIRFGIERVDLESKCLTEDPCGGAPMTVRITLKQTTPASSGRPTLRRHGSGPGTPSRIRRLQLQVGEEPCFRTEKRYTCRDQDCRFSAECRRRVASWHC